MPVPVWGWAEKGATVEVEFAGQKKQAVAGDDGRWQVELDPMGAAFEGRPLKIRAGAEERELEDIQVGEVWICSGQSNMQMAYEGIPEIKKLVPEAKNIRSFEVKRSVAFDEQDFCEGTWKEALPNSAVAFSFAYFLEKAAEAPVGIILTCWGSSGIEGWMPADMVDTVPHFKTIMDEFEADTGRREQIQAILDGPRPWSRKDDIFLRRQNNVIYNAMMHPLAPFANRGLVWYQGERNTQSMFGMIEKPWWSRNSGMLKYGDTLKAWIKRYRKEWGQDEMEFLIVMLPGYGKIPAGGSSQNKEDPDAHSWAWMRESQLKALELPATAVVNTIDLGDVKNIHPKDKLPIGKRLALLAARETLGKKSPAQGPVMSRVEKKADRLVVHFDHAGGLKTTDGESPSGFWITDDSKNWVRADAKLDGEAVVLSSAEMKKPLYVRYAFAGLPSVNLVNEAGLPAFPFRTDAFKP